MKYEIMLIPSMKIQNSEKLTVLLFILCENYFFDRRSQSNSEYGAFYLFVKLRKNDEKNNIPFPKLGVVMAFMTSKMYLKVEGPKY